MSDLNDEDKQKLSIITNSTMRKRLARELISLINKDDNPIYLMDITYNANNNNNQQLKYFPYSINLYESNTNRIYEIVLSNSYPFAPPKLNINYKPYSHYFRFSSPMFKEALYKYKKIRCFCCETITCGENWSPALTIKKIISEVHKFEDYCKEISHRVIIDVIKRKYLISDINLLEWLY
jgi:ubiquitin-protein ligase